MDTNLETELTRSPIPCRRPNDVLYICLVVLGAPVIDDNGVESLNSSSSVSHSVIHLLQANDLAVQLTNSELRYQPGQQRFSAGVWRVDVVLGQGVRQPGGCPRLRRQLLGATAPLRREYDIISRPCFQEDNSSLAPQYFARNLTSSSLGTIHLYRGNTSPR